MVPDGNFARRRQAASDSVLRLRARARQVAARALTLRPVMEIAGLYLNTGAGVGKLTRGDPTTRINRRQSEQPSPLAERD